MVTNNEKNHINFNKAHFFLQLCLIEDLSIKKNLETYIVTLAQRT